MSWKQRILTSVFMIVAAMVQIPLGAASPQADSFTAALRTAMSYDGEFNDGNPAKCSQLLAEKHYLEALELCSDPKTRALIYSQLGALFNTNYHRERGEKPDFAKARTYFTRALEIEPRRIGFATIRARLGLATPDQAHEERLRIRIKNYEWLSALSPETPENQLLMGNLVGAVRESDRRSLLSYAEKVQESAVNNMLYEARRAADEDAALDLIIRELPGTPPAIAAQQRLDERMGHPVVPRLVDTGPPVIADDPRQSDSGGNSPSHRNAGHHWLYVGGCALLVALSCGAFILRTYRRRHLSR